MYFIDESDKKDGRYQHHYQKTNWQCHDKKKTTKTITPTTVNTHNSKVSFLYLILITYIYKRRFRMSDNETTVNPRHIL